MERFEVILPSTTLKPYVKEYWFLSADNLIDAGQRAVPSGCVALSFNRGGDIFSVHDGCALPSACVFGQTTNTNNFRFDSFDLIMVLFQSLGAKCFFDVPMNEFKNQNVSINYLNNPMIIELENRLMECFNNQECASLIEYFLLRRLRCTSEYTNQRLSYALNLISTSITDIRILADQTCLSYKQFKRIFQKEVGLNPKEYIQIQRFSRTLNILQNNTSSTLEDIAFDCGYSDKSHLIKEFRALSDYSPSEFKEYCDPYCTSKSLFQSFFINIQ